MIKQESYKNNQVRKLFIEKFNNVIREKLVS